MDGRDVGGLWSITVHGKGGRDRDVYLPDDLVQLARAHHEDVAHLLKLVGGVSMGVRLGALRTRPPLVCAITAPVGKEHSRAIDDDALMASDNLALSKAGLCKTLKTFFRNGAQPNVKRIRLEILLLEEAGKSGKVLWSQLKGELARSNNQPTLHKLRHTFATTAVKEGVPYDVIQTQLGHQDINTTISTYAAAPDARRVAEINRMT